MTSCFLKRSRKWMTVEPVLFLCMTARFLTYLAYIDLVHDLVCQRSPNCTSLAVSRGTNTDNTNRSSGGCEGTVPNILEAVQTDASHFLLYSNIVLAIPAGIAALVCGHISDTWGRKLFFLVPSLMTLLSLLVVVLILQLQLDIYYLLLAVFLDGLGGSFCVVNVISYSYIADTSSMGHRTARLSILEGMFYFAATLGGLLSGIITENIGYTNLYLIAMCCYCVAIYYVVIALPESVSRHHKNNKLKIRKMFSKFCKALIQRGKWSVFVFVMLIGVFFLTQMTFIGLTDVEYLFALGEPLCWSSELVGYFSAVMISLNGLASLLVAPLLSRIGVSDHIIVAIGLISGIVMLTIVGVAAITWEMFLAAVLGTLRGMYTPTLRSMLSKLASEDHQGVLFAILSIAQSVATLVASLVYNSIYPAFQHVWPGLCFVVMATSLIPALLVIIILGLKEWKIILKKKTLQGTVQNDQETRALIS